MKNLAVLSIISFYYITTVNSVFGAGPGASWTHKDSDEINPWWPKKTTSTTTSTTTTTTKKPYKENELMQECINSCPVTPEYNPVCGTNGVTYDNPGKLECARQCGVDVVLHRKSKCTGVDRGNLTRNSIDSCVADCPVDDFFHPVCGSNGVTYVNPARLKCVQNCGVSVNIAKFQPCFIFPDPNEKLTNIEVLACRKTCPATSEYRPVCGTDGNNYKNEEVLQCARKCGINVSIKSRNVCPTTTVPPVTPEITTPKPEIRNKEVKKLVKCMQHCPLTSECKPVCGTDGITYRNPGRLTCSQLCGLDVQMSKYGQCTPFPVITFANCQPSGQIVTPPPPPPPTPLEKCLKSCWVPNNWNPVCGTNDITYKNMEDLLCAQNCGIRVWLKAQTACTNPTPGGNYGHSGVAIPTEVLDKIFPQNLGAIDVANIQKYNEINPSESLAEISSPSSAENKIMIF